MSKKTSQGGNRPRPDRSAAEPSPIALLEEIKGRDDKTWGKLAPRYGVANPDPPWKVALAATCECLSASDALPSLDRRRAEDQLGETLYRQTPAPEQQILALAHTLLSRGLLTEEALARRMETVRTRLEAQ